MLTELSERLKKCEARRLAAKLQGVEVICATCKYASADTIAPCELCPKYGMGDNGDVYLLNWEWGEASEEDEA